jgi:hypothetical protein
MDPNFLRGAFGDFPYVTAVRLCPFCDAADVVWADVNGKFRLALTQSQDFLMYKIAPQAFTTRNIRIYSSKSCWRLVAERYITTQISVPTISCLGIPSPMSTKCNASRSDEEWYSTNIASRHSHETVTILKKYHYTIKTLVPFLNFSNRKLQDKMERSNEAKVGLREATLP